MSLTRTSLRAFLSTARSAVQRPVTAQEQLSLVIGNESADLDSITSSILYAFFRTPPSTRAPYIPLLNIPRADVEIRPELIALLPHANLEASHLIALDETPLHGLDSQGQLQPERTRWVLVDHNKLSGALGQRFAGQVVGCIDHHIDEKAIPSGSDEPRIVRNCGSCTSLVINHFRPAWDALSSGSSTSGASNSQTDMSPGSDDVAVRRTWDAQIAKFALASILVDTQDLTSQHKVTRDDTDAVDYLLAKIALSPKDAAFDRHAFYRQLDTAKSDLGSIDLLGILRKDYKQWEVSSRQLGISTVVQPLSYLERRFTSLLPTIQTFVTERELSVFAVMTASSSETGNFQRELLLLDRSGAGLLEKFHKQTQEALKLKDIKQGVQAYVMADSSGGTLKVWQQGSLDQSRKQVAPLLRDALS